MPNLNIFNFFCSSPFAIWLKFLPVHVVPKNDSELTIKGTKQKKKRQNIPISRICDSSSPPYLASAPAASVMSAPLWGGVLISTLGGAASDEERPPPPLPSMEMWKTNLCLMLAK